MDQRVRILESILQHELVAPHIDLVHIGRLTDGFSGSDLKELCRAAAVCSMRDLLRDDGNASEGITQGHFLHAYSKFKESKVQCGTFSQPQIDLD